MTDLTKLTITEALKGLKEKKFSAVELTKEYLNKMESIMMIVTSGPTILRIRLAVSKPSISGIFQSMRIMSK